MTTITSKDKWVHITFPYSRAVEEKEWSQWLLFYGATYSFTGFNQLSIQGEDIALMFRLTFGL